jgi:hypothetical protein
MFEHYLHHRVFDISDSFNSTRFTSLAVLGVIA